MQSEHWKNVYKCERRTSVHVTRRAYVVPHWMHMLHLSERVNDRRTSEKDYKFATADGGDSGRSVTYARSHAPRTSQCCETHRTFYD